MFSSYCAHGLRVMLLQVSRAGTAEADAQLLQVRLSSIQKHCPSSSSSSSSSTASLGGFSSPSSSGLMQVGASDDGTTGPVCKYFLAGSCSRGDSCTFRHTRPICKFYLSRTGCVYGSSCRFLHGSDGTAEQQQAAARAGLSFDWPADAAANSSRRGVRGSSKTVDAAAAPAGPEAYLTELLSPSLGTSSSSSSSISGRTAPEIVLVGEGDFSFTLALAAVREAARLSSSCVMATVLERNEQQLGEVYPGTRMSRRCLDLLAAGGVGEGGGGKLLHGLR